MNVINSRVFLGQSINYGLTTFTRLWSVIDLVTILTTFTAISSHFYDSDTIKEREVEVILMLCIWFKSLYFLSLIGEIAPLVDITFVILHDIRYFIVIFAMAQIAFISAFYMIGQN